MKISIIGPVYPYRGGISHYTFHLNRAIQNLGHSTQIISFHRQYPGWLYPGKNDLDPSQVKLSSDAIFVLDPFKPWTWYKAIHLITNWDPDLIVIQWWTTFWGIPFSIINKKLNSLGYRVIYLIHNVLPHEERSWDRFLTKISLYKGHFFIVQSPREQERLRTLLPKASAILHAHPIYPAFSTHKLSKIEARRRLKVPVDIPLLLFFGIVRPYKGLRVLIEALGTLRNRGAVPNLMVAGEFWENVNDYKKLIERFELNEQVFIENRYIPNEEVELFFSAADIMVAPYVGGSQSGAASLALANDLPLIVSQQIAEGIKLTHKKKVWTYSSNNVLELADTIQELLGQLDQINFSGEKYVDEWIEMAEILVMCATNSKLLPL